MQCRRDAGRSPTPIKAAHRKSRQLQRIGKVDHILADRRLFGRARLRAIEKARRRVAAKIDGQRTVSSLRQKRRHAIVGVRIIRKAVEKDDRKAGSVTGLVVRDL
jgi:hypothetical protein